MFERFKRFDPDKDDERIQRKLDRKRERLVQSAKRPMLPGLSSLFFWMTVGAAAAAAIAETANYFKYDIMDLDTYLRNLSFSCFAFWALFGVIAALLSLGRLIQIKSDPSCIIDEKKDELSDEITPWHKLFRRRPETAARYSRRCIICCVGILVLLGFYMAVGS